MPAERRARPADAAKVQRWLDVVAALLRRSPDRLTFVELAEQVPAYGRGLRSRGDERWQESAVARMWERDKDELRALGVPIGVYPDAGGNRSRYGLETHEFYLPFVHSLDGTPARRTGGPPGVSMVAFSPEELAMIRRAAGRAAQLGDPAVADAARRAMASVAHDLAAFDPDADHGETVVGQPLDPTVLRTVGDALVKGRRIQCRYRSMHRDVTASRTLEPLGLVFQLGHWYVVARDPGDERLKTFRASRMSAVESLAPNGAVAPPRGFALAAHAASREAWELGDGEAVTVRLSVAVHIALGDLPGAAPASAAVGPRARTRAATMQVRRLEPFLRWLLAFGGEVRPTAPRHVVQAFRDLAARTAATYGAGS